VAHSGRNTWQSKTAPLIIQEAMRKQGGAHILFGHMPPITKGLLTRLHLVTFLLPPGNGALIHGSLGDIQDQKFCNSGSILDKDLADLLLVIAPGHWSVCLLIYLNGQITKSFDL
jgi:hypothetical protein